MLIDHFNNTIDIYINSLSSLEFERMLIKPAADSWSLGQLYTHLLNETNYFLQQIEICLGTNEYAEGAKVEKAIEMFRKNEFPDERAKRDGIMSDEMDQPIGLAELQHDFLLLRARLNLLGKRILESPFKGKTQHPGLGYFSALEWYRFAEMHMRHHLKQKRRIEDYLASL